MSVDSAALLQFKLYRGLGQESLEALAQVAQLKHLTRGEQLWRHGDEATGYWSLISGLVKSYRESPDGREQVLCLLGPGNQLGTMAVLANSGYPCHATVIESGEALFFPTGPFKAQVRAHHDLALQLLGGLAGQCNVLANRIEDLSLRDASGRLGHYLLQLPVRSTDPDGRPILHLPVSKTTLASMLGISRETLSRTFADLQHQGLLMLHGRDLVLLDIERLENLELGDDQTAFAH